MARSPRKLKQVETLRHQDASRKNIPTAEYQGVMAEDDRNPIEVAYERRNRDLDPQLVWRGKDEQDGSDLVVQAPPLFIQEKVQPKVLIDDLRSVGAAGRPQTDLFADFNGLPSADAQTEFYQHDANWSNRMILGDSLQVMASLAEREGLRGKVQCIYIDPPYGIKFNSNFQWSTTSRDVRDGNAGHITREPEQVKAFRDTWRDGIHSYLTYLRDRLTVARGLLTESGSVFVQIGDENVHRVRTLMDEVFGNDNLCGQIAFQKTGGFAPTLISAVYDYVLWYGKDKASVKYRKLFKEKDGTLIDAGYKWIEEPSGERNTLKSNQLNGVEPIPEGRRLQSSILVSAGASERGSLPYDFFGREFKPAAGNHWKTSIEGLARLRSANRLMAVKNTLAYVRYVDDFPVTEYNNVWSDTVRSTFAASKLYVVQTSEKVVQRCTLMTTDPGDLVLDPTCGSGTTAYVAEQWGRRWITIDTSRVALALARARIMGARYPYYLLADSRDGQIKEAALARKAPSEASTYNDIRQGFVYERVPHITLKSIANNAEIDVIWEKFQETLEPLLKQLDAVVSEEWKVDSRKTNHSSLSTDHSLAEWEVSREFPQEWLDIARSLHEQFWTARVARQREIDASIAAKADYEYLYDKPCEDNKKVRVAGPFTVESLSPHRLLGVDENDELIDNIAEGRLGYLPAGQAGGEKQDFAGMILDHLKTSGVQQAHKEDRIAFSGIRPWPGDLVCAEGTYVEGDADSGAEKRAGIFVGPEFGTVSRPDLVEAVREAADADFDVLIACAFNYDAHASEFNKLGRVPVLKARMNADLHMADDLKNTGKGNLFVVFGEPDITVTSEEWLVDSLNNRVAPYDIFKVVSGIGSLAEINGLDGKDLRAYAALSCRGEIWDYLTDAAGGVLDSGEHRGRTGKALDGGISSVAWRCTGLSGGTGNLPDIVNKAGNDKLGEFRALVERLHRDQQNAQRADRITIHSPLTTHHYAQVAIHGVDVFHPNTGEIRSDTADGIACWFVDTDYNEESFFVRHAYFLGANDPYKALKTTLKAEINREAWETLHSDTSRPFDKPTSDRIAVKVINHLGDEVMKVFRV